MTLAPQKLIAAPLLTRLIHMTLFCAHHAHHVGLSRKWITSHSLTWLSRRGDKAVWALASVSEEKGVGSQGRGST